MEPLDADLTNEAVAMMKSGLAPDDVLGHLVQLGSDPSRARAIVDHLLVLKRQADACDPQRLSQEAAAMIARGAPPDAALQHLTSGGIAEQYARPEVDRLLAVHRQRLASMRPCDRCRTPMVVSEAYFDRLGNQVCRGCHVRDEISAGDMRVEEARLEAAGVPLLQIQDNNKVVWCPRCRDHSAVCTQATHVIVSGMASASRTFQCTRCSQVVSV